MLFESTTHPDLPAVDALSAASVLEPVALLSKITKLNSTLRERIVDLEKQLIEARCHLDDLRCR